MFYFIPKMICFQHFKLNIPFLLIIWAFNTRRTIGFFTIPLLYLRAYFSFAFFKQFIVIFTYFAAILVMLAVNQTVSYYFMLQTRILCGILLRLLAISQVKSILTDVTFRPNSSLTVGDIEFYTLFRSNIDCFAH